MKKATILLVNRFFLVLFTTGLCLGMTGWVVNQYVQKLAEVYHLPKISLFSWNQPATATVDKGNQMEVKSAGQNQKAVASSEPGSVNAYPNSISVKNDTSAFAGMEQPKVWIAEKPVLANAAGGNKPAMLLTDEQVRAQQNRIQPEDKLKILAILTERLPQSEIETIFSLLKGGVTPSEAETINSVLKKYLTEEQFNTMKEMIAKYQQNG